jgi:hypothetical protein
VTAAYNLGKYGNSPIGCRPKEGKEVQKIQAGRAVVYSFPALALFAYMPLVWYSETAFFMQKNKTRAEHLENPRDVPSSFTSSLCSARIGAIAYPRAGNAA